MKVLFGNRRHAPKLGDGGRRNQDAGPTFRVVPALPRLCVPGGGRYGQRSAFGVDEPPLGDHEGHPYYEMEYAPGGSLADRLDGTPWPVRNASATSGMTRFMSGNISAMPVRFLLEEPVRPAACSRGSR